MNLIIPVRKKPFFWLFSFFDFMDLYFFWVL